jgi:hypothetical protein
MSDSRSALPRRHSRKGQGEGRDLLTVARRCSACEQVCGTLSKRTARVQGLVWLCRRCEAACDLRGGVLQPRDDTNPGGVA